MRVLAAPQARYARSVRFGVKLGPLATMNAPLTSWVPSVRLHPDKRPHIRSKERDEMTHTIHDVGVASQIGAYSDALEAGPNLRWLMTSGTPGLSAL